jgi:predicted DCC family thiol-disulfide oxidoreductase YuxK
MAAEQGLVLYDGDCPFCRHCVKWLRRFDWLHRLQFVDFRTEEPPVAKQLSITPERLREEMHVIPPDRKRAYHGFGAFRWTAWRLPPLWPLAPLLYLPLIPWLGQKVYLWIARNRFRLVPCRDGVCSIERSGRAGMTNDEEVTKSQ